MLLTAVTQFQISNFEFAVACKGEAAKGMQQSSPPPAYAPPSHRELPSWLTGATHKSELSSNCVSLPVSQQNKSPLQLLLSSSSCTPLPSRDFSQHAYRITSTAQRDAPGLFALALASTSQSSKPSMPCYPQESEQRGHSQEALVPSLLPPLIEEPPSFGGATCLTPSFQSPPLAFNQIQPPPQRTGKLVS